MVGSFTFRQSKIKIYKRLLYNISFIQVISTFFEREWSIRRAYMYPIRRSILPVALNDFLFLWSTLGGG